MNDKQYLNFNLNTLTISTLNNLNNMKTTQVAEDQQINWKPTHTYNTTQIIDNVIWFGLNYTYDFIDQCWSDDLSLANHLKDKFSTCTEGLHKMSNVNSRISYGVFTRFLTMLDSGNRERLYNYILSIRNQ